MKEKLEAIGITILVTVDGLFMPFILCAIIYHLLYLQHTHAAPATYLNIVALYALIIVVRYALLQLLSSIFPRKFRFGDFLNENKLMLISDEILDDEGKPTGCFQVDIADDDDYISAPRVHACLLCDDNTGVITQIMYIKRDGPDKQEVHIDQVPSWPHRNYVIPDIFEDKNFYIEVSSLYILISAVLGYNFDKINSSEIGDYIAERSDGFITRYLVGKHSSCDVDFEPCSVEEFQKI